MKRADVAILEYLDRINAISTPKLTAIETDYTREWVSTRLRVLLDHGLVEQPSADELPDDETPRGLYRITDQGRAFLVGEFDPNDG